MDKWIIFDFDNTMADALSLWIYSYNQVAPRYGFELIEKENYDILRNKTAWQIKNALGVSWWKAIFARRTIRKIFAQHIGELQFYPGMKEVLFQLHARGFRLGIFSSNRYDNINQFLSGNGCRQLFQFIEPEASLFFKSRQLKRMLKRRKINPAQAAYIGDETKDVDAAKFSGMKAAAVTWGVNTKEILQTHHSDFLAEKPEQLLDIQF